MPPVRPSPMLPSRSRASCKNTRATPSPAQAGSTPSLPCRPATTNSRLRRPASARHQDQHPPVLRPGQRPRCATHGGRRERTDHRLGSSPTAADRQRHAGYNPARAVCLGVADPWPQLSEPDVPDAGHSARAARRFHHHLQPGRPIAHAIRIRPATEGQQFHLDGVENRDPDLLGVPLYPPPEAIAEMKVDSGVPAPASTDTVQARP